MRVQLIICYKDGTWKTKIFRDPKVSEHRPGNLKSKHYESRGVESEYQIGNDIAFAPLINKLLETKEFEDVVFVGVANVFVKRSYGSTGIGWNKL